MLVEEHMGLVRGIAFRYRDLGLPVEDLVQEGAIGLLAAIDDYDSGRGTSFSTHAFWRVRGAVTHALTARGSLIRVPRPVLDRRRQVLDAQRTLSAAGQAGGPQELGDATALTAHQVAEALAPTGVMSLDGALPDGTRLADRLADDPAARPDALTVTALERLAVRQALRRLEPRKQTILERHFGIDRRSETLTEIAADLHLSPARTRVLKDEAMRELASDLADVA
ncbi:MAG TPA: sigma-70 family RNA polymerase sigma factor [Gaiellaceae bacterium]|nr:sigma-70 family RNA polymerase sigma factor [Gaiellaceae bacterium]